MTKTTYNYPLEGPALPPTLILADPPARIPLSERRTLIEIHSDGKVVLDTTDPRVVRPIAKAIAQGADSWMPVRIEGADGRQTHWVLEGDESLISIRERKFKRPGIAENLKKKDPDPEPQPTPAPKATGLGSDDVEVKTAPRTKADGTIWSELKPEDQTPVDPNDPWGGFEF